jgi:hypothetical protein
MIYDPTAILRKLAPEKHIKKMISRGMGINRAALSFVERSGIIKKKDIATVALKVAKQYRERIKAEATQFKSEVREEIKDDPKLLINRVQQTVLTQVVTEIKEKYYGEKFRWLPSDAEEPDPEHQLKYGKVYTIGVDEMPQDRFGCRCGMEILVEGDELEL